MILPQVNEGTIILRQWSRAAGLRESARTFQSLDELYALCLSTETPEVIDRIVIEGQDEWGHPRVVTFVFQSITVSPDR